MLPQSFGPFILDPDAGRLLRDGNPVRLTDFATGVKYMQFTEAVWESWNSGGARVAL